jgi:chromosome segregation ATPase
VRDEQLAQMQIQIASLEGQLEEMTERNAMLDEEKLQLEQKLGAAMESVATAEERAAEFEAKRMAEQLSSNETTTTAAAAELEAELCKQYEAQLAAKDVQLKESEAKIAELCSRWKERCLSVQREKQEIERRLKLMNNAMDGQQATAIVSEE